MGHSSRVRSLNTYQHMITIVMSLVVVVLVGLLAYVVWQKQQGTLVQEDVHNSRQLTKPRVSSDDEGAGDWWDADQGIYEAPAPASTSTQVQNVAYGDAVFQPKVQSQLRHEMHQQMGRNIHIQQKSMNASLPHHQTRSDTSSGVSPDLRCQSYSSQKWESPNYCEFGNDTQILSGDVDFPVSV